MNRAFHRPIAAAAILALTACASASDQYPSLARRDVERISGSAEPATAPSPAPVPQLPADAAISARLAALVERALTAHGLFEERRGGAERSIGSGGAVGSEGWAVANVAVSSLESARSEAMVALAEIDEIYAAETIKAAETGNNADSNAAAAAKAQVDALVEQEDQVLARLRSRID